MYKYSGISLAWLHWFISSSNKQSQIQIPYSRHDVFTFNKRNYFNKYTFWEDTLLRISGRCIPCRYCQISCVHHVGVTY